MATDLAIADQPAPTLAVRHGRPLLTRESLTEEGQQRQVLMAYVQAHMIEGTDFGLIPGTKNKTLLKPGAEKLTDLFRCSTEFEIVRQMEDWDKPMIHYLFRCRIVSRETGGIVAEGFGSCNSHESKYRYRNSDRLCPHCGKPTIIVGKKEYGGGFVCFVKKGGCGAKFDDRDQSIVGQVVGKMENPDIADVANTILKMAKKRAHVDAAIALARCSDMFTQDAEDMPAHVGSHELAPPTKPTEAEFMAMMTRKGWTWSGVLRSIDKRDSTTHVAAQTVFSEMPAAVIVEFTGYLESLADKTAPKPAGHLADAY